MNAPPNRWRVVRKSRNTGRVHRVLYHGSLSECELWLAGYGSRTGCSRHTWNAVEREP